MLPKNPDIVLSRSWRDHKEADEIIRKLKKYGIDLAEDIRDMPYTNDLPKLTKRVLDRGCVIAILSGKYLESLNCANEIIQLRKETNAAKRTAFVLLSDVKSALKTKGGKYYIDYWKTEKNKLKKEKDGAASDNIRENISQASKKVDEIILNIKDFFAGINKKNSVEFDKFKKNSELIIKIIGGVNPELTKKAEQKLNLEETIRNEQKKLKIVARNKIRSLRKKSLDKLLAEKDGALQIPLKVLEKKEELSQSCEEIPYTTEEAANLREPAIIFGRAGQGKTILSTIIAEKILDLKKRIPYFIKAERIAAYPNNSEIYNTVLSQSGIGDLNPKTLDPAKFCFLIDDFQRLSGKNEKKADAIVKLLSKGGSQVILFSEFKRRSEQSLESTAASGYKTIIIDSKKIAASKLTDKFIETRFSDSKDRQKIKIAVLRYGKDILGSRQNLFFLTSLLAAQNKKPKSFQKHIQNTKVLKKILSGKPLSKFELHEAFTDYAIGMEKIKIGKKNQTVKEKKEKLCQKAFNDIFDPKNSIIKGLKSPSLLCKNGKNQEFAHDLLKEFFLVKYFVDRINSGILSVEDAYNNYWTYIEDFKLWDLPENKEWRALLPDWEKLLMMAAAKLDPPKAESLLEIIGKNYNELDTLRSKKQYNPFAEDKNIFYRLAGKNTIVRKKLGSKMVSKLVDASPEERKTLIKRLEEMKYSDSRLSSFKTDKATKPLKTANVVPNKKPTRTESAESIQKRQNYFKIKTADVLGELGHYDPKLSKLLQDEDWEVRKSAADALAKIGHYDPWLMQLLNDVNFYVRKSAARALGKIKYYDPKLIKFLKDENPETRWRAANILGEIKRYNPELTEMFEDENAYVRWSAIDALGKMKRYDSKLPAALKDENIGVRRRAADALKEIADKKIIEDYQKLYGLKARVMESRVLKDIHQAIKPSGYNAADNLRN